jgi:type II secretory pathway pseudopilin PulG
MTTAPRLRSGFTLIEVIITSSIMMALVVGSIAGYGSFNRRNTLKQAALTLKNNLRLAQNNANTGNKPSTGCAGMKLDSYRVLFTSLDYSVTPVCGGSSILDETLKITLPKGITISNPIPSAIDFLVLSRGTTIANKETITLTNTVDTYTLDVLNSGDIEDTHVP